MILLYLPRNYIDTDMDIEKEIYMKFIKIIKDRIEFLEHNDPENSSLDELKLLLSDNVSDDGKIHIRYSLLNKQAHHLFSNYNYHLEKFNKEHLYN